MNKTTIYALLIFLFTISCGKSEDTPTVDSQPTKSETSAKEESVSNTEDEGFHCYNDQGWVFAEFVKFQDSE